MKNDLKERTKKFALRVIRLCEALLIEADELLAITVSSIKTARKKLPIKR